MNCLILTNPKSGNFIGLKKLQKLQNYLLANNIQTNLYLSEYKNSITEYCIKNKDKYDDFIAVGGDGTINEVIQLSKYKSFNLAIIPTGTANVLAKEFNICETNLFKAADTIIKNKKIRINTWLANDRIFLLMLSGGIDSMSVENINLTLKKYTGKFSYIYQAFKELFFSPKNEYILDFNNSKIKTKQFFLMNISKYAGNFKLTKPLNYNDKKLELIYFNEYSNIKLLLFALFVLFNSNTAKLNFIKKIYIDYSKISHSENSNKLPIQFDGDAGLYTPLEIKFNNSISLYVNN
ncbi:MAG TPA: diacylglycerol kinase family protein [bacterium]|nr:diacylglycerol kinase family protein [bacterium]